MPPWSAYPSRVTTGINSIPDTYVHAVESIGTPDDAPAMESNNTNSGFALLKGICASFGLEAGSGQGDVNDSANIFADLLVTLGEQSDPVATGSAAQRFSAISLLKGILNQVSA